MIPHGILYITLLNRSYYTVVCDLSYLVFRRLSILLYASPIYYFNNDIFFITSLLDF